jgi:peptide/nickel transport system substrate-binding protein
VHSTLFFNFYHQDKVLRDIFRTKEFRIALSYAIDREEINDLNYKGLGTPMNVGASPLAPQWYIEEYSQRYAEYDPDKANSMLDELGLKWDNNREYRLRPDGKRLQVELTVGTPWPGENVANCELVKKYWNAVGVGVVLKPTATSAWVAKTEASQFDVLAYAATFGFPTNPPYQHNQLYAFNNRTYWGVQWANWMVTGGKSGEEPPAPVKRLYELYQMFPATGSEEDRIPLYREAMKIHADNFWMIGCVSEPAISRFFVVNNKIGNATEYGLAGFRNADAKFSYSWPTYFFKD